MGDNGGLDYGFQVMDQHRKGKHVRQRIPRPNPLCPNVPFAKAVVLRPVVKKPKKPNSANRKCVVVRLSNGGAHCLCAWHWPQPSGAQCCVDQKWKTAGRAQCVDKVWPRKI